MRYSIDTVGEVIVIQLNPNRTRLKGIEKRTKQVIKDFKQEISECLSK